MYPNPQDALPLPPRPDIDQYKKRAKELVTACKSNDPDAIRRWAAEWMESLARSLRASDAAARAVGGAESVERIAGFAAASLKSDNRETDCALSKAQFVIARAQGFLSWPKFQEHLHSLQSTSSSDAAFEAAADAVVEGDLATLRRLLAEYPQLIRARSSREHRATLLHYVSANGVENYRQRTPKNAVQVAETLLAAGADVLATADVYGGGATTLGLVATSCHPQNAGVQRPLIDVLVKHGAPLVDPEGAGNKHNLVNGCLANGRRDAAEYLADFGAPLDLEGAAGVGRLERVRTFFDAAGALTEGATEKQLRDGFSWACEYGRADVVRFLVARGVDVRVKSRPHGQTGLHWAAFGGHPSIVEFLLQHGADVRALDDSFKTTPLFWALYAWFEERVASDDRYYEVAACLVEAGSMVNPAWREHDKLRADSRMLRALGLATP